MGWVCAVSGAAGQSTSVTGPTVRLHLACFGTWRTTTPSRGVVYSWKMLELVFATVSVPQPESTGEAGLAGGTPTLNAMPGHAERGLLALAMPLLGGCINVVLPAIVLSLPLHPPACYSASSSLPVSCSDVSTVSSCCPCSSALPTPFLACTAPAKSLYLDPSLKLAVCIGCLLPLQSGTPVQYQPWQVFEPSPPPFWGGS